MRPWSPDCGKCLGRSAHCGGHGALRSRGSAPAVLVLVTNTGAAPTAFTAALVLPTVFSALVVMADVASLALAELRVAIAARVVPLVIATATPACLLKAGTEANGTPMQQLTLKNNAAAPILRALIVEDRPDVALGMELLLGRLGHAVLVAHRAEEALLKGAEFQPDVIFLDIGLPDISGYDLCKDLRANQWGSKAYIVAVTGHDEPTDLVRAATTGFDRHVGKPMAMATLTEILEHVQHTVVLSDGRTAS